MTQDAREPIVVARALVDVSCYACTVPRVPLTARLRQWLRSKPYGSAAARLGGSLELETPAALSGDVHPVVIEVWRVRDGHMQPFGVDQDVWARWAGSALGAWSALAWAPFWFEALRSRRSEHGGAGAVRARVPTDAMLDVALTGASAGARNALKLSAAARSRFGHYCEAIVAIPCVSLPGLPRAASLVVDMRTDSRFAREVDRLGGFGLSKRAAAWTEHATGVAITSLGRPVLTTRDEALTAEPSRNLPSHWSAPLLGTTAFGSFALTRLDRVSTGDAQGLRAQLEPGADLRWLLPELSYRVGEGREATGGWKIGGVRFELHAPLHVY